MTYVSAPMQLATGLSKKRKIGRPASSFARHMTVMLRSLRSEHLSVADIIELLSSRDRIAIVLLPAFLAVSPATIAFGVASICGLMIAAISLQILASERSVWLPRRVRSFQIRQETILATIGFLDRPLFWLEQNTRQRLLFFVTGPCRALVLFMCAGLGLAMPLLELVPFSATTGGLAITTMVLGLLMKDGLVVFVGTALWVTVVTFVSTVAIGSTEAIASMLAGSLS